ncbi:aminotransferase class I/II-fold pyridoxal phosphate-dependent enzyme [Microbulbifer sp. TYP-18]|uniref:aminotransferase class I/II-fold pyridoxal phosphate-dependent enzyme n=1 Tax=Microbulbifer sp. TYP-18 TaxID=3230024 RepID=UPI0034C6D45B
MQIEEFSLERIQSLYENTVPYNLSDSGVHPYTLKELLTGEELAGLQEIQLGYGWTNGAVELRQAIADLYRDRTGDEVIVTNGSAEANFLLVSSLIDPGDEIVVITPNYLQIHGWAMAIGANVKTSALRPENGWKLDLDQIEDLVTDKTRLITICHPNNPTGALLNQDQLDGLIDIARRHDVYLHGDEVYKGSELDGDEPMSIADLYEKGIATSGLSKAMALPGLRIGWLVGPAAEIYDTWRYKDYTSITTSALSEYIGQLVLAPKRRQAILSRSKTILRENRALLTDWIHQHPRFSFVPPKAGGMAFVSYRANIGSTALAHSLREEKGVLVLPGDVYGLDGYLRLGIGERKAQLEAGLERLGEHIEQFS